MPSKSSSSKAAISFSSEASLDEPRISSRLVTGNIACTANTLSSNPKGNLSPAGETNAPSDSWATRLSQNWERQ